MMQFRTTTLLALCASLPLLLPALTGCEVDVEEEGEMPTVDVEGDTGQLPQYEVEQTQEGRLPDVDVDAEPGKLPEVDVRGPDVDVGTDAVAVPVPDVDVDLPDEQPDQSNQQGTGQPGTAQ
jgi:hypothetical protein